MPGHLQESFGCVVTNRFDQLLDDESDPFEVLKAAENKKKEAAAAGITKSAAQAAKQTKKESQKDRKNPLLDKKDETQTAVPLKKEGIRRVDRRPDQQGQPGSQHQAGQGEGRPAGERRPDNRRPPRERRFDKPIEDKPDVGERGEFSADKPFVDRPPRGRGGGRGGRGGRGRGMGRGDGFDSRGKRDFDRHSGGGDKPQKSEEKRGGSGSHNRGNPKDETRISVPSGDAEQTAAPGGTPEGVEHPPADSENKENEVEEPKEEGPKEMTLDEWKAMQDKERAKVEFNIRKPNEGADSKWNKGYVLHKSKSEDVSDEKLKDRPAVIDAPEIEADTTPLFKGNPDEVGPDHHFRKPANDITAQLEINFGDLGRRGRGGARGGRGGRGAGGGRSEKPGGVSVPNVDDPEAFPALA
ncbi:SERPINE1 mRNA-binding protein 1-like isoform 1-T1 [Salvelinus alpinus]|uniref:SERPINE1 mRNA-binding protein 1-like isoform X1 n=1 Tax=Salvelinus alpinus TaxID=8036 RepID=UPI0039FDA2E0